MHNLILKERFLIFLVLIFILSGCANIVAPTGGPKDEDPPRVLRSIPEHLSTGYSGEDVRIFFDEFVALRNLNANLLVSPPLTTQPEVRIRGRSIIMSISDTLAENTTYVFFFGESIVDITEGNAIPNFRYVVSTGDFVDSLSVRGVVKNAFTLEPEKGVFVMMYDNIFDSVPMLERPIYISKTDDNGNFSITNMRDGQYLLFALLDMNANFLYDNPDEQIAFVDSLIRPEYAQPIIKTTLRDTIPLEERMIENGDIDIEQLSDTLATDTVIYNDITTHSLFLFKEKDTHQRLLAASLIQTGRINFAFRIPTESVHLDVYREPFEGDWYQKEFNATRDSLTLWFPNVTRDSLFLIISDRGKVLDTLSLSLVPRQTRAAGRRSTVDTLSKRAIITTTGLRTGGVLPYYRNLTLQAQTPLQSIHSDQIQLFANDTISIQPELVFTDSINRNLELVNDLDPTGSYTIVFNANSITDIFGNTNDSIAFKFRMDNPENYGTILVNITLPFPNEQYVLQVLDAKYAVIAEKIISSDRTYDFRHLTPSNYLLRLIHDKNQNGIWDTGNYLRNEQPEPVFILKEPIQARANWEVEVIWNPLTD